jgi:hypothetical protein
MINNNYSSNSKFDCSICSKAYLRKSSYDKHRILCEFKLKSKTEIKIDNEEQADIPSYIQLVKIVQELTLKLNNMEEKMEEMQKWVDKKKKKINIVKWLNDTYNTENNNIISFTEWSSIYLKVDSNDFENLMENSLVYTIQKIFDKNMIEKDFIYPIKCFTQKQNMFYIYSNSSCKNSSCEWRQMTFEDLVILLKIIQNKMIKELTIWKTNNQGKFDDNDKISELFNKAIIKLMNISFTQDSTFSKIRNMLYNYLKVELKIEIDNDFEF